MSQVASRANDHHQPSPEPQVESVVDVELTSRCGASCSFCPRDQTPHQGVMDPAVFARALGRVADYAQARAELGGPTARRSGISFCGLGDQLLNPHLNDYIRMTREAGLGVVVNTNAQLLDEKRSRALIDAGAARVFVNGGALGDEYRAIYGLPFERMERNVRVFLDIAGDDCELVVVLVDHDRDATRVERVREHWQSVGVTHFLTLDLLNRGGSLEHTHEPYGAHAWIDAAVQRLDGRDLRCGAPAFFPFVAYDGRYLLCSSDWNREVVLPTVFDCSIEELMAEKLAILDAGCHVCEQCNHHPRNAVADLLAAADGGFATAADVDEYVERVAAATEVMRVSVRHYRERAVVSASRGRRRIPVRVSGATPIPT